MAYERTHEGLRVVGGDFVVLANGEGQVVGSSVAQEAPVEIASTTPSITADRAAAAAKALADQGAETSTPELVIWHRDAGTKLAYEVEVRGTDQGEVSWQKAWVDATTGRSWSRASRSRTAPAPAPGRATSRSRPRGSGTSLLDDQPQRDHAEVPGRRQQHDLLRHRQRVGQRGRHQQGDRLRRRVLQRRAGGDAVATGSAATA